MQIEQKDCKNDRTDKNFTSIKISLNQIVKEINHTLMLVKYSGLIGKDKKEPM
jgi:hypothetical protein